MGLLNSKFFDEKLAKIFKFIFFLANSSLCAKGKSKNGEVVNFSNFWQLRLGFNSRIMSSMVFVLILVVTPLNAHGKNTTININHSFYTDARKQGLSFNTVNTIAKALSWKVDFNRLHKNDKFIIIGSQKKYPDAIVFKRRNKVLRAFLWHERYFDKNGISLQSDFLTAPLTYTRISSEFQLRRYHPILKTYLPHRALDYAAPYGTPVYNVADGFIEKRKNIGALGNAIFIRHGNDYQSVYAHLSKFYSGLYRGKKVKKGQIIGYVGSTGRSTGPHLHFEIRYKGKRQNPQTYRLPAQIHLSGVQLQQFKNSIGETGIIPFYQ